MPSSNKFPGTKLNHWSPTDKPVMDDFNHDNQILENLAASLGKAPYIGPDGYWYVWDVSGGAYTKSSKARGDDGAGFRVLGLYASPGALTAAHPTGAPGDAYGVGTAGSNTVYVWSADKNAWEDIGRLQGPQGVQGPRGEKGEAGPQGPRGLPGTAATSTLVPATLLAERWTGEEAPYLYTLTVPGVTATSANEILPSEEAAAEEIEAMQAANIADGGQGENRIVLRAWGTRPDIDLPLRIIIRGDL